MEVRATAKAVRMSPLKVRLVVDLVRGRGVQEALDMLQFMPQRAAHWVAKVVRSAAANAENNYNMVVEDLYIASASADSGPIFKRFRAAPRGRVAPIWKRTCHVTVVLAEKEK
ncbi:MAG: 50S ribosomal protein L22 [Chloroflexi bacterium]|nr:50S ribosomal protein L22 [Chloroflexota bacterium]